MAVISQEIANLPIYKGEAWRAESGYSHGRQDTAGDVIRFERDELGNDYGLSEELIKDLDQYHASALTWVTRERKHCLWYLSEGESDECVSQPYLGANPRIIADTGEEGALVLHGDVTPISQYTQTAQITDEQIKYESEPIPFTPVKRLLRDDILYVTEKTVPHPIKGYAEATRQWGVVDLRGFRKGYEPRGEIRGTYTPNPRDMFRIQTGHLPPYQPIITGDKVLQELRRLGWNRAYRIAPPVKVKSPPKRVTFERGNLQSAIEAARRLKSDKDLYIIPTAEGLTIERTKPPTWIRHVLVRSDGSIKNVRPYMPADLQTVAEEVAGPTVQEFQKEPIYPLSLTMADYERIWKPQGWNIIFIGPTSTWRQDWGTWEAIRDIVQNCLDEAESYQWGYDDLGLWISDKGRGVAVADFLLGPPKLKPDWARGKFGEGMKISALAMVRDGYPVKIETVGRELFIVFLEQEVDGHVQSLAALWRPNGTNVGTTFHFIGYKGTSYSVGFAVNLPREAILFQAPSLITKPRQRYNLLIQADFPPVEPQLGEMRRAVGWKGELTAQSRIFARDIFMKEINSPYSYNLWSFELAPDRFAAKDEREMWRDVGRLWACVNRSDLLTMFLQMIKEPPTLDTDESRQVTLSHLGTDPSTGMRYEDILETNKEAWQQAWQGCFGENALIRTDDRWDATVRHLGYEPININWDCRDALSRVITTDRQLVKESQERLRDVKVIHDDELTAKTRASLNLARAIIKDISVLRKVGGVHAAMIPPASDRVRTAGMYGTQTEEIFISADQLERGKSTVDTTIHEMAHHTSGAEDGEEAHNAELSRLGGLVVQFTARGNFDEVISDPNFMW
jgi:hypothetical protein